ncbi:hypothetical protein GCM10027290_43200 [Micromonospora sonneratiae]|uniref:FG-GAP-like repeat-containing protein n=1 Tax=Micromonospora sonneratiae TaxID=1184706 RepID=A0ABW3YG82_9ACTN
MWGKRIATVIATTILAVAGGAVLPAQAGGAGEPIVGDLNADGLRDRATLGVKAPDSCVVKVELGRRPSGYQPAKTYTYLQESGADPISCPDMGVAVDLGGDGTTELVLAWFAGRPPTSEHDLLVLRNYRPAAGFDAIHQPSYVGLADFNGDGRLDLYQWTDQGQGFATYLNTTNGQLVPGPVKWCSGWPQFRLADFDRNGAMDVVIAYIEGCGDYASGVVVIRDDGQVTHIQRAEAGDTYWSVNVLDANRDSRSDLVIDNPDTRQVRYYLGTGDGRFVESPRAVADTSTVTGLKRTRIAVLANDYATAEATISIVTQPRHGTVQLTRDRQVIYTPLATTASSDRLVYQLTEHGRTSRAAVTITRKA